MQGRQDQYANTVTVEGRPTGIWKSFSGGAFTSTETKFAPGGMGDEISLGGRKQVDNIEMTRGYDPSRDEALMRWMIDRRGQARVTVSRQKLDADARPIGRPFVYGGVLMSVTPADNDAESTDPDTWTITISTDGSLG